MAENLLVTLVASIIIGCLAPLINVAWERMRSEAEEARREAATKNGRNSPDKT